jgi:hypothetical protein
MRVISGFVAVAMLAALTPPALAVCVNRGGATTCYDDPKYWTATVSPEQENPDGSVKTIVLHPSPLSGNAWVMTPQGSSAADVAAAAAPACSLGVDC